MRTSSGSPYLIMVEIILISSRPKPPATCNQPAGFLSTISGDDGTEILRVRGRQNYTLSRVRADHIGADGGRNGAHMGIILDVFA